MAVSADVSSIATEMRSRVPSAPPWVWVVASALAWNLVIDGGLGATTPPRYAVNIPAQALETALREFALQAGTQIVFLSAVTEGWDAPALTGQYTLEEALRRLLSHSSLTWRQINPDTVEVTSAPEVPAEQVADATAPAKAKSAVMSREFAADGTAPEEVLITGSAEQLVATRTQTPLREIPQTLSIISAEQIHQQNDIDLYEALEHAVGVSVVRTDSLDANFYARGFEVTGYHIDGGAAVNTVTNILLPYQGTPDLSEFDHIELLRGADALFAGGPNPGATVSLVRKRPLAESRVTLDTTISSWNNKRVELDSSSGPALDGKLRARFDGVYQRREYFYDLADMTRGRLFGVIDYDVGPQTVLTMGGSYQHDQALPFINGLPLYPDGSDAHIPRGTGLTVPWSNQDFIQRELYLQLQHHFGESWKLRVNIVGWDGSVQYELGTFATAVVPGSAASFPRPFAPLGTIQPGTSRQRAADITLSGNYRLFGWQGEFATGGDFMRLATQQLVGATFPAGPPISDVYAFDPQPFAAPFNANSAEVMLRTRSELRQYGWFVSTRLRFNRFWSLVGGGRLSGDRTHSTLQLGFSGIGGNLVQVRSRNLNGVTPYGGIILDLNHHYSLYASYAEIYQGNGGAITSSGRLFGIQGGIDTELGLKASWRGGRLNGTAVLYRVVATDVPIADNNPPRALRGLPGCCANPGTHRSHGFDAEINGSLQPGWLIGTGYTYNVNHAANGGGPLSFATPRHLLKLWTSRQLPGRLNRWTIGADLDAQSGTGTRGSGYLPVPPGPGYDFVIRQGSYAVVGLRTSFQVDPHWLLALTVNNLFDRTYYATLGATPAGGNWYGEPRNFALRIEGNY